MLQPYNALCHASCESLRSFTQEARQSLATLGNER